MSARDLRALRDQHQLQHPSRPHHQHQRSLQPASDRYPTLRRWDSRLSRRTDFGDSRESLNPSQPPSRHLPKSASRESVRLKTRPSLPTLSIFTNLSRTDITPGTPYEQLPSGKPPIPITVAPRPSSARIENHPSLRPRNDDDEYSDECMNGNFPLRHPLDDRSHTRSPDTVDGYSARQFKLRSDRRDPRCDSGVAISNPTTRNSHATFSTYLSDETSGSKSDSPPRTDFKMAMAAETPVAEPPTSLGTPDNLDSASPRRSRLTKRSLESRDASSPTPVASELFVGLTTHIPTVSLEESIRPDAMEFSKRGSMLIMGERANEFRHVRTPSRPMNTSPTSTLIKTTPIRELSADEELMSRRVRAMYASGISEEMPVVSESKPVQSEADAASPTIRVTADRGGSDAGFIATSLRGTVIREDHELAGGIEDWQDVESGDVDRFGFISPKSPSNLGSTTSLPASPSHQIHRVSTQLQMASEQPRRGSRLSRTPSGAKSHRSMQEMHSKSTKPRPLSSQSSHLSVSSSGSRFRHATNRLPYNRHRRLLDEAGDMLTLPPGLADVAAQVDGGRSASAQKQKEFEREGKWRKMARVTKRAKGGGMSFEFDTTDPKLISRTWKGIPDRWRASAWYAFLSASARRQRLHTPAPTETQLMSVFEELQNFASPDDAQIDTDVPRTIGAHIMFRARYRGGQRLLFRLLHAVSLYFPQTGYVQGMAALAATLLCYYEEAQAFVMLVRLWTLRGLDRLYAAGFGGLMNALDELDTKWLTRGGIGSKLRALEIASTSYGTRWYLTLFNYSIPFPAQLRVWDVFFLLGDPTIAYPPSVTCLTQAAPAASMSTPLESQWIGTKASGSKEALVESEPSTSNKETSANPNTSPSQPVNNSTTGSMTVVTKQKPVKKASASSKSTTTTTSRKKTKAEAKAAAAAAVANGFHGGLDVLHATACALVDATSEILVDADFELAMRTLTSWVPVRDDDLLMKVAHAEYVRHAKRRR